MRLKGGRLATNGLPPLFLVLAFVESFLGREFLTEPRVVLAGVVVSFVVLLALVIATGPREDDEAWLVSFFVAGLMVLMMVLGYLIGGRIPF